MPLSKISTDHLREKWPKACCDFFEHWLSLREDALIPTFEKYSLALSPAFLPGSYIVDPHEGAARMRFQGTDVVDKWKIDVTGQDLLSFMTEDVRAMAYANYRTMADHPCGHINTLVMSQDNGRNVTAAVIQLPLKMARNSYNSLVGFLALGEDMEHNRRLEKSAASEGPGIWLDVGAGLPLQPPLGHEVGKNIVKLGF